MEQKKRSGVTIAVNIIMVLVLAALGVLLLQRFVLNRAQAVAAEFPAAKTPEAEYPVAETPKSQAESAEPQSQVNLAPFATPGSLSGILRRTDNHTIIPKRSRQDVITYTVQRDDTLFAIADAFGIKPETLLWGNFDVLQDNPHLLKPGQVLNILPVNGTYYKWQSGDTVSGIAGGFKTTPDAILFYPGNNIDLTSVTSPTAGIQAGTWVIVPDGKRDLKDWGPPAITRSNPAAARYYGDGSCGSIYEGAVGTGTFVWPTPAHTLSGYNYSGIHPAIDIAGAEGNAVFASDSGVVVFAGWSNFGYGYLIAIDHGNGYQTAYAHLSAVAVTCGQSVYQGGYIGAVGNTGNSYGSHLHFELSYGGAKLNPLDYLP
jgi:murein DD-endopeptidase MepM/ murein hydrolase activator NlpD